MKSLWVFFSLLWALCGFSTSDMENLAGELKVDHHLFIPTTVLTQEETTKHSNIPTQNCLPWIMQLELKLPPLVICIHTWQVCLSKCYVISHKCHTSVYLTTKGSQY